VYIGTDIGAFFKDASLNVWQPFSNGLPNVIVTQLHIHYATSKIRASTYGRGMWESDLYLPGSYPPVSAFGASQSITCPGAAIQFTDYSAGQPSGWSWQFPGGNPTTSTAQNPVVYYNTPGNYPVTLVTTNVNGTDSTTNTNYIQISQSTQPAPQTTGAQFCTSGSVSLTASGSGTGTLRWWDAPGGGNLIGTGSTLTTNVNGTTDFYVDEELPAGTADIVGEAGTSIGAGSLFTANDIRGLYFDVLSPVILQTVEVYSGSAGNRTIEIIDGQGNTYADTTVFIPASPNSPYTVTLNFTLYPGTGYFIKCRGLVDLYRNSSGATYPYTSTAVNITGSNAGSPGYYYFFYFWNFTEISCNTPRAICTAVDTCAITGLEDLFASESFNVYPNPGNGFFNLEINSEESRNLSVVVSNVLGEKVYSENWTSGIGLIRKPIDLTSMSKGVYLLVISDGKRSISRKLQIQ
jgi:PKD repeat protein